MLPRVIGGPGGEGVTASLGYTKHRGGAYPKLAGEREPGTLPHDKHFLANPVPRPAAGTSAVASRARLGPLELM